MKDVTLEDFKKWGSKGGKKRWENSTEAERSEFFRKIANKRWAKHKK